MNPNLARQSAILSVAGAADLTGKEGFGVTLSSVNGVLTATLSASATTIATGVVLDGRKTDQRSSVGILGALGGTVRVKLGGDVQAGAALVQKDDGTWITDPGNGARVKSLIAAEGGGAGALIEAAPLTPIVLS